MDQIARDSGVTVQHRAAHALEALFGYADACGYGYSQEDFEDAEKFVEVFSDFLGDLRHLADVVGLDYADLDSEGQKYWAAEV